MAVNDANSLDNLPPYIQQLGLERPPFANDYDVSLYFPDPAFEDFINQLTVTINYSPKITVILGADGDGKTTMMTQLIGRGRENWRLCYLSAQPGLQVSHVLQEIMKQFEVRSKGAENVDMLKALSNRLMVFQQTEQIPVICVDESQLLSPEILTAIFSIYQDDSNDGKAQQLLKIVLFATADIKQVLKKIPVSFLVKQALQYIDMPAMSQNYMGDYINYRLMMAGANIDEIYIAPKELKLIVEKSALRPGNVNFHAHQLLLKGKTQALLNQPKVGWGKEKYFALLQMFGAVIAAVTLLSFIIFQEEINQFFKSSDQQTVRPDIPVPEVLIKPAQEVLNPMIKKPLVDKATDGQVLVPVSEKDINQEGQLIVDEVKPVNEAKPKETKTPSASDKQLNDSDKMVKKVNAQPAKVAVVKRQKSTQKVSQNYLEKYHQWLMKQPDSYFTIQLVGVKEKKSLIKFMKQYGIQKRDVIVFYDKRDGEPWYTLLYGIYQNKYKAEQALRKLPPKLKKIDPWLRELGSIKDDISHMD